MTVSSAADVATREQTRPRRRGRPRKPGVDEAIIAATLEILEKDGFAGLTVEAISARAGVGRPALYRRWPSKEAIVKDALLELAGELMPYPDTGSLRGDLAALMQEFTDAMQTPAGRVTVALIGEGMRDPTWRAMAVDVLRRRRQRALVIVERAIERGELPPNTDGNLLFDLVGSPLWVHQLIHDDLAEWVDVDAILDAVLDGMAAIPSDRS